MSFKYGISTLALSAALIVSGPAAAQLGISIGGDRGVNVGVDVSTDDGIGVGADVGVGGDDGINAGADVGIGGSGDRDSGSDSGAGTGSGIGVGVDVGIGRDSGTSTDQPANLIDLDVGVGSDGPLVNLDGSGNSTGNGTSTTGALVDADVTLGGTNLLGLNESARGDALIDLIGTGSVGNTDLDTVVDDRRIIIVDIGDRFSDATLADIDLALGANRTGTDETRAAVSASVKLSTVLGNNGLSADDVLAIQVGSEGQTHVYVQPRLDDGLSIVADVDALGIETADADVNLLQRDNLADADLDILPQAGREDGPLVDLDAEIGSGSTDLAQADIEVLGDDSLLSGDLVILPGSGDGDAPGGDDGDGDGGDDGDNGDTPGNGDDDDGATGGGDDDGDTPGDGDGDDGTPGGGSDGNDGGTGGGTTPGTGGMTAPDTTESVMVSTIQCPTNIRGFLEATTDAASLRAATMVEIAVLTACPSGGLLESADFSPLRALLTELPLTQQAIASADITVSDVVSATVSGDTVTLYAVQ